MQAVDYPTILTNSPQAPIKRRVGSTFGPAFVEALRICAKYKGYSSVYICSLVIDPIDKQGGAQIAWLRKQSWRPGAIPTAEEERGALGEWMILRRASHLSHVEAVSLVSMKPVCAPDLIILADPTRRLPQVNIDIKTTAAKSPPAAHYNLTGNQAKGMPHFLVAILSTKRKRDKYADLYFVNAIHSFTSQDWLTAHLQLSDTRKVINSNTSESIGLADAFRSIR
jgi:hypothetical protein